MSADVERFLASQKRYRCEPLSADLTEAQCKANRERSGFQEIFTCKDCAGLGKAIEIKERVTDMADDVKKYKQRVCLKCKILKRHHGRGLCPNCYMAMSKEELEQYPPVGRESKNRTIQPVKQPTLAKPLTIPVRIKNNPLLPPPLEHQIILNFSDHAKLFSWLQEQEVTPDHIIELLGECYRRAA